MGPWGMYASALGDPHHPGEILQILDYSLGARSSTVSERLVNFSLDWSDETHSPVHSGRHLPNLTGPSTFSHLGYWKGSHLAAGGILCKNM